MEKRIQPPAVKIDREIFEIAEKERQKELKKGNPVAMSLMGWISYLILVGLKCQGGKK